MALKAGYKGIKKIGTGLKLTTEGMLSLDGSGPSGSVNLDDLGDVAITDPADGNILVYDSTDEEWKNVVPMSAADKVDITAIGTNETGDTSSKAYAVGEHFYKNGKFCTCIQAIAQGATFTLNTNYVEGTVADVLQNKVIHATSFDNVSFATKIAELWTYYQSLTFEERLRCYIYCRASMSSINNTTIWYPTNTDGYFQSVGNMTNELIRLDIMILKQSKWYQYELKSSGITITDFSSIVATWSFDLMLRNN